MPPLSTIDALDDDLTRRRFRLAAAAGGWGLTRDDPRPNGRAANAPRTVLHPDGPTTHWRTPQRPHAGRTLVELDTLLALGVVPTTVGRHCTRAHSPWQALAQEADVGVIDAGSEDGAGRLRAAGVDLVIVSCALAATAPREMACYRSLGIPIVALPGSDVGEQLRLVGAALDLDDRAANLAAEVELALDAFRAPRRPASIVAFTDRGDGQVHVFTGTSAPGRFLRRLGLPDLTHPSVDDTTEPDSVAVPRRRLAELDADLLLGLELSAGALTDIEADPRFAHSPAVRGRRYSRLDPVSSYALAVPSALTVQIAVDAVRMAL